MITGVKFQVLPTSIFLALVAFSVPLARQAEAICGYADPNPIPLYAPQGDSRLAMALPFQQTIQPSQQAFVKWDPEKRIESITVQPRFEGNARDFGMLMPTPARPKIDEMPRDLFRDLARFTLLFPAPEPMHSGLDPAVKVAYSMPSEAPPSAGGAMAPSAIAIAPRQFVRVLEAGVVGSLDYKILESNNSSLLFDWLKQNNFNFKGDEPTLKFYIDRGWIFTVMRIDSKQMKKGPDGKYLGEITPTCFSFSCNKCIYPLRITQHSVKDKTEALFYIQAPHEMDLPKQWSWKHSYRPVFLKYRLDGGAGHNYDVELQSRQNWLSDRLRLEPNFVPTELEWAKRLTQSDMNTLENPAQNYSTMAPMDLPPGSKVLNKQQLLQDYKTSYESLAGGRERAQRSSDYACFDSYPPESGGFSVRYPDEIVGKGMFPNHYAFYRDRIYIPAQADSVVRLKGHLQNGQWLTKFSRSFTKEELSEDMVLDELVTGQEVTYTRLLPNASAKQLQRYQEQCQRAAATPVSYTPTPMGNYQPYGMPLQPIQPIQPRVKGNISPYRKDVLKRIAQNWHPRVKLASAPIVELQLSKDGQVLSASIEQTSGVKKTDKEALAAIEATEFAPLPQWYSGESLTFKVDFSKVEAYSP